MKKFILFTVLFFASHSAIAADPALNITTFNGKNFNLADKKGKIVIVNFWASWCIQCRQESIILEDLYQKYNARGLEVIGVTIDEKSEYPNAIAIAKNMNYPNAFIDRAKTNSFGHPDAVPTTYIIDRKGNLSKTLLIRDEIISAEEFEKALAQLF